MMTDLNMLIRRSTDANGRLKIIQFPEAEGLPHYCVLSVPDSVSIFPISWPSDENR